MNKIIFEDWMTEGCSDGCCGGDWGTRVIINGKIVLENTYMDIEDLKVILKEFDLQCEFLETAEGEESE